MLDGTAIEFLVVMTGLSQGEFGELLGVERMTVWRWTTEESAPRAEHAELLEWLWEALLDLGEGELMALVLEAEEKGGKKKVGFWKDWMGARRVVKGVTAGETAKFGRLVM